MKLLLLLRELMHGATDSSWVDMFSCSRAPTLQARYASPVVGKTPPACRDADSPTPCSLRIPSKASPLAPLQVAQSQDPIQDPPCSTDAPSGAAAAAFAFDVDAARQPDSPRLSAEFQAETFMGFAGAADVPGGSSNQSTSLKEVRSHARGVEEDEWPAQSSIARTMTSWSAGVGDGAARRPPMVRAHKEARAVQGQPAYISKD